MCHSHSLSHPRSRAFLRLLPSSFQEFTRDDNVELYILTKPFGDSGGNFRETMRNWVKEYMFLTDCDLEKAPTM